MKKMTLVLCAGLLTASAAAAYADTKDKGNDAGPVASAKVSLESAVSIAEKHANGKAVRAEYEKQKDGTWVYDVEIKAADVVTDVKVDAEKGTVLASKVDAPDSDDDNDKED